MGWNSWNRFGCDIDETMVREMADAMITTGMKDVGYAYVNLDDCWQVGRDAQGGIVADPVRFASGMAKLAEDVHAKGLRIGTYTCAGSMTCQQRPGSLDHEAADMATYSKWGIDYVKVDWCFTEGLDATVQYPKFRDGIAAAGRPMILSLCNWGQQQPWIWGGKVGQLWRTSGDISDSFYSMMLNFDVAAAVPQYAGPGHWNDPDMLEVGNGGMTEAEYRGHMALWAVLAAPLVAGNDLRTMDESTRAILTNPEVIAIDQDPMGVQAVRVVEGVPELLYRPLAAWGSRAFVVFNRSFEPASLRVSWTDLGLEPGAAVVRDPWGRKDLGTFQDGIDVDVPSHEASLLLVRGTESLPPAGETFVSDLGWAYSVGSQGPVRRDLASTGAGLSLRGVAYDKGLGAFAGSIVLAPLGGLCDTFRANVGIDDAAGGKGSATFEVWADSTRVFESEMLTGASAPVVVDVSIAGARYLRLVTTAGWDAQAGDHVDWAGARVTCRKR
jgi:alpha-galactosidase